MKIAIESPDEIKDTDLEEIVNIWNRKKKEYLFDYLLCSSYSLDTVLVCIVAYNELL